MSLKTKICTPVVAAIFVLLGLFAFAPPLSAQDSPLDLLFEELKAPDAAIWSKAEKKIWRLWSKSGSDSMDLLFERGKLAMNAGDLPKAVEHFTALTDHAPDFAEGWNARATVFFMMQEFGLSVHDIEITLRLNPRHFGALSGLGMIYETLDLPNDALRAFRAALAVHPNRPDLLEAVKRLEDKTAGTLL